MLLAAGRQDEEKAKERDWMAARFSQPVGSPSRPDLGVLAHCMPFAPP